MAAGQTGRTQVRAYRFATRQLEWAVTQGDPLLHSDPSQLPRRWTLVSLFVAIALLAGFGVYGRIKPAPDWRDAALLLDTDSGALYVNRAGVLYQALNLTSALLATDAGAAARPTPKEVGAADLVGAPRGPLMGIPGAPSQLPSADNLVGEQWSVCDLVSHEENRVQREEVASIVSSVVIGQPPPGTALAGTQALLATADTGTGVGVDYLIWNGRRSRIDPTDQVIAQALQLEGKRPRVLSTGLLNAIPEVAPITVPAVVGSGAPTAGFVLTSDNGQAMVAGAVFMVVRAGNPDSFHVVHTDGVERISPMMADLLRFKGSATVAFPTVAPNALAAAPVARSDLIASDAMPLVVPELIEEAGAPLVCAGWEGAGGNPRWMVTVGSGMPAATPVVALAGTSPQARVSRVVIAPSHGAVVNEWVPGQASSEVTRRYLVSDLGVAYPLAGGDALARLGFRVDPANAPKQVLDLLPRGPVLDPAAATRLWDSIPDSMLHSPTLETTEAATESGAPVGHATAPMTAGPASETVAAPTS